MTDETKAFIKDVMVLALPTGLQMMIESLVSLVDNIMIGSLGEASITAVSVSSTYLWLCNTIMMSMASGAAIIAAQDYGSKNLEKIKKMLSFVMLWTVIIGCTFTIITSLFPKQILKIYTNIDTVLAPGVDYLRYIKWSIPLFGLSTAITLILRSVRSVKLGLYNSLLSCFSNVFFNWIFIFGHLGAPKMGVAGAALGTLIARILQVIIAFIYLFFIEKNLGYKLKDFKPNIEKKALHTFVKITIPILLMDVFSNLVASVQTMITGRINESYISANSITHMAWQLPNVFCWGVGAAAAIMIGNSLGEENYEKAKNDSKRFIYASVGFGIFCAIMVQILLPILLNFYNVTDNTKLLARQMGYMASICVFFIAFAAIICNGVIKSAGHTNILLRIDLISSWLIAIPLGYIAAFVFKWPAYIIYIILRCGNIIKSIWGICFISKGNWMKKI